MYADWIKEMKHLHRSLNRCFFFFTLSETHIKIMRLHILLAIVAIIGLSIASEEKTKEKEKDIGTVIGIDLGTTYSW